MKNLLKRKVSLAPQPAPQPRTMEDINKEYSDLIMKAGIASFRKAVEERNLNAINDRLMQVNQEADQRSALDKELAEAKTKSEETK